MGGYCAGYRVQLRIQKHFLLSKIDINEGFSCYKNKA